MISNFGIHRRNHGHWDVTCREHGRLFRLRGGPGEWCIIDERVRGKSTTTSFKDQSAAMAYVCAELMHELLTVEGQKPYVMESWNVSHNAIGGDA